ncbi:MAG: sigma-54-dependent Fis family transcriptional regulator, partial [Myxococcales bacterium]|nr:sigma-54-dependent Fis family transcriptional regulator [Myxococcales bacterium]
EKGAFTGAVGTRAGVFERAHGGTLLIDEIGDLALDLQPKLLRAVERGEIYPLGGGGPTRVDVRVIAATRRDLDREIQAGRFRDDLFHRLAVARIELPPLRRRRGDVALLVKHFCRELGYDDRTIPTAVLQQWNDAAWPGNVRELKNAVARHVMLGDLDATGIEILAGATADDDWLDQAVDPSLPFVEARKRCVEAFERRYVERVLEAHGGSVKDAARAAGVAKRYFQLVKARASRERS